MDWKDDQQAWKCGYLGKKLDVRRKMKIDIRGQMLLFCSVHIVYYWNTLYLNLL